MTEVTIEEAVHRFLQQEPTGELYLAYAVVMFNWERGERDLENLICIEQYTHAYADAD